MRVLAARRSVKYLEFSKRKSRDAMSFAITADKADAIKESLISALGTLSRDDMKLRRSRTPEEMDSAKALVELIYSQTMELLTAHRVEEVYLCNGRMPEQVAVALAAAELNIKVFYFERGTSSLTYYLSDLAIHDRVSHQERCIDLAGNASLSSRARDWFEDRISLQVEGSGFTNRWKDGEIVRQEKFWLYASSSTDEFANLGTDWQSQDWMDQWQFVHKILGLRDKYTPLVIRLHPNLANKYLSNVIREIRRLKEVTKGFSSVEIISPLASVNSYALAQAAEKVFVWNSTLGLEASWLGTQVITGAPSYYDEVAAVSPAHSPGDLESLFAKQKKQDPYWMKEKAENSMFHQLSSDQPITHNPEDWIPQDFQKSFRLRLEYLLSTRNLSDFARVAGRSLNLRLVRAYIFLALR